MRPPSRDVQLRTWFEICSARCIQGRCISWCLSVRNVTGCLHPWSFGKVQFRQLDFALDCRDSAFEYARRTAIKIPRWLILLENTLLHTPCHGPEIAEAP